MKKMATKKQKKLHDKPIYLVVKRMIDPDTGEVVGCLVPDGYINNLLMRQRKFRVNEVVRATITNPRSEKFHRLVHQLGTVVRQNIDGFESIESSHEAIKILQRDSGVCCDVHQIVATPIIDSMIKVAAKILGDAAAKMLAAVLPEIKEIPMNVPKSIAFDCMDESEFKELWGGLCKHIVNKYWQDLNEQQITEMIKLMPRSEGL